ncbi:ABC transporter substrate-binding protein [Brevibacterium aurantiacum]|uniref:Fe/B12 periplasmic-binding domain-containing protein n=1 Tax=Brevibacterium aurantiacum TaxID=273384 RepID=A0A2A3Z800_BREAU|nr:ABC transporter substrate-binding protein [Brevibacterium aurantiacum]PCC47601.1 hypothetical protein CIK64_04470 [Brevibacterium aurantiacum]
MSVSPSADTRAPWKRFVVATTTMLVLLTSGCTAADDNSTPGDSSTPSGPYPITVENFDGGVTIDKAPERIVVLEQDQAIEVIDLLGYSDHVIAYAQPEAVVDRPYLPAEFLRGGEKFNDGLIPANPGTISPEAVAALDPDLIIGPDYLDESDIEKLNATAPLVTTASGNDDDQEIVENTFLALGKTKKDAAAFHDAAVDILHNYGESTFGSTKLVLDYFRADEEDLGSPNFGSKIYFETGLERGPLTAKVKSTGESQTLSWENFGDLAQADIFLIASIVPDETRAVLEADPRWADLPAVKNDLVFYQGDPELETSTSNPLTPLGAQHFVDTFGAQLAERLHAAGLVD